MIIEGADEDMPVIHGATKDLSAAAAKKYWMSFFSTHNSCENSQ